MDRSAVLVFLVALLGSSASQSVRPVIFPDDEGPLPGPPCETGGPGRCVPHNQCAGRVGPSTTMEVCQVDEGTPGVCCPELPVTEPSPVSIPQEPPTSREADLPPIQKEDLDRAGEAAREVVGRVLVLEQELQQMGLVVTNGSKESLHRAFFRSGNPELRDVNRNGMVVVEATQQLMRQFHLNNLQGRDGLPKISVRETVINDSCPIPPPCPSTKYRTVDGSCNNLKRPQWGKAFTAFQRLLPPDYADGVNLPRVSVDNGPLPSSRDVSGFVVEDRDRPNPVLNLVLMQWGQFLDHDLTLTGVSSADNGEGIICCNPEIIQNPRLRHPACFPIGMGPSDPFFAQFQQSCMEFVRSVPAPTMECSFGPRQQINQITSFIDASNVYGSSDAELNALRSFRQGRLIASRIHNQETLPIDSNNGCFQEDQVCFKAGDSRVNEQTSLAVMHTIWLREHNRIAGELSNLNPGWTDEILFQETRRIIIAMMQHITYNEYLPLIVGRRIMKSFNMDLKPRGYKRNYDTSINPTILNVFATAAYRFGHSLVQGLVALVESDGSVNEEVQLFTQLFNPEMLSREGYVDRFLRGLVVQPVQRFDHFLTTQVTHHLFQATGETFGLDLASLNIQRGRDHGLPGYNAWRRACGLKPAQSFEELAEFLHPEAVEKFRLLYRNVDDIDIWAAGIAERPLSDATLGPTFACLIAEQFRRLMHGDRFWYENGGLESSLSPDQLDEIRKSSLARLMCDNTEGIVRLQPLAFIRATNWNPIVDCDNPQIPKMTLEPWMNEPVWA